MGCLKLTYNQVEPSPLKVAYRSTDRSEKAVQGFIRVDPLADDDALVSWTPYNYSFNNPVLYNDPYGDCPPWICGALAKHISENPNGVVAGATGFVVGLGNAAGGTIDGVVNLVTNPVGAMEGLSKLSPMNPAGNVEVATGLAMTGAQKLDQLQNGNALEKGVVVGEVVGAVVEMAAGTKGTGALVKTAEASTALKVANKVDDVAPTITKAYSRPANATTATQRKAVQGQPCVDCGATGKMVADHKTPLVKEYYQTGKIDYVRMRDVKSVQPQCPTCSAKQGAQLKTFSQQMKEQLGL